MSGDSGAKNRDEDDEDQKERGIVLQNSRKTNKRAKDMEMRKRHGSTFMVYPLGPFATSQNSKSAVEERRFASQTPLMAMQHKNMITIMTGPH